MSAGGSGAAASPGSYSDEDTPVWLLKKKPGCGGGALPGPLIYAWA